MSFLDKILPKEKKKEYFLTVGVEESRITATVSLIENKEVTIIGTGISEFDDATEEIEAADIAISAAEKKIGEDILVQKVVFGLPFSLLDNDAIRPQHLSRLKKITKTLSLVPCGFIEYPQALAYYLESKEESPPTLLLLSVGKKQITFSHIRVGKIEKNVLVEKTSSFTADFEKALGDFSTSEILPSRIMLYDESGDTKLSEIQEELLRFAWHKHSSFLHTPKIETLEMSALTYALVESAAKSLTHVLHLEEKENTKVPEKEERIKKEVAEETFGFVKGQDIAIEDDYKVSGKPEEPEDPTQEQQVELIPVKENVLNEEKITDEDITYAQQASVLTKLPKIDFTFPRVSFAKLPVLVAAVISIAVLALIFFSVWYFPKATVNLIVYPETSSSQVDILFTTNTDSLKSGKNTILATAATEEVSSDKTSATTGTTKIGEKAAGTVTIYNKTLSSKLFPKGTLLVSDNLKFTLNDDVTIASASDTGEGLTFGKIAASVIAGEIGPDSNLATGSNFTFRDFGQAQYYAKNNDKFTGGTSRDITSVSKDDQDKLLSSLTEELTSRAKQIIIQKLTSGEKLLDVTLDKNVTSKKFSKNVNEEAKELSLSLTLKVTGLIYKEQDLTGLTRDNATQVPSGFTLASGKTRIKIDEAKLNKNGDILGKAIITYFFFPQIDIDNIKSAISGKSYSEVDKYLSTVPNIGGVEIIAGNKIPILNSMLPIRKENTNINLVSR